MGVWDDIRAIIKKFAALEHALILKRDIDQKTLEGERREAVRKLELDHKATVSRLWEKFRQDRKELDAAKADEIKRARK